MIQLSQSGDAIQFGTAEHRYKLDLKPYHFKSADVDEAATGLLALYPGEAETIQRYAARLRGMVR